MDVMPAAYRQVERFKDVLHLIQYSRKLGLALLLLFGRWALTSRRGREH